MRKYAVILLSLIAMVIIITAVFAGIRRTTPGMQVRFNKRDFPEHGVHIITPLDPSFDAHASKHLRSKPPETLKPFSVFIHNAGPRMVVAYALTWKFVMQDGKVNEKTVGYSEPGILMGQDIAKGPGSKHTSALEPGNVRCFDWSSQIAPEGVETSSTSSTPTSQSQENQTDNSALIRELVSSELSKATDVTVSLDGVVFDDGIFVGSNVIFFQQLQATVNAKIDLLREIAEAKKQGKLDEALESIKARSLEPDVVFSQTFLADDYYRYFRKLYATEIRAMSIANGKEQVVSSLVRAYHRARPILKKQ